METLRTYLATLVPADQAAYALRCGTTIGYLRKALSTKPRLDGAMVRRLDEESGGIVSRYELRPDVFGEVANERHRSEAASAGATAEAAQVVLTRKAS
jgi:hypothetical protein